MLRTAGHFTPLLLLVVTLAQAQLHPRRKGVFNYLLIISLGFCITTQK
jgi:hypothetical protein